MSGEAIVIALIREDAGLLGMVATLKGEELEVGDALNGIGVTVIDDVDDRPIRRGASRRVTERVQATVYAKDSTQRRAILKALKRAVADQVRDDFPAVTSLAGVSGVAVIAAGRGPNFRVADSKVRGGSVDFMVSYNEAS